MCEGGPFRSLRLLDSGGLGCSIEDKTKGPKAEATWRDSELLREFKNSGLQRIGMQKG
jgi:hypothetical protein